MKLFVYVFGILLPFLLSFNGLSQPLYKPKRYAFTACIEALSVHKGPQSTVSFPPVKELLAYQAEGKIPYIVTDMDSNFVLRLHIQSESPQREPLRKGAMIDFGIHSPTLFFSDLDIFDEGLTVKKDIQEERLPFILLYIAVEEHAVYKLVFDSIRYMEGYLKIDTMSYEQKKKFEQLKEHEEHLLQQLEKSLIDDIEKIRQKSLEDVEK